MGKRVMMRHRVRTTAYLVKGSRNWIRLLTVFKFKPGHISPTPEESEAIRAAIAEDPETFELDAEWFREARPMKEELPELWEAWYGNGQEGDDAIAR